MPAAPGACPGSGVTVKVKLLAAIRVLIRSRLRCRGSTLALRYTKLAKTARDIIGQRCLGIRVQWSGEAYEGAARARGGARDRAVGARRARRPFGREYGGRLVLAARRRSGDTFVGVLDRHGLRAPVGRDPGGRDNRD